MKRSSLNLAASLMALATLYLAGPAWGQLPMGPSTQFDITGFLEAATLDTPADILSGGKLWVNSHLVIVPRNTVVQFPANAITWQQVFAQAPIPYGLISLSNGLPQTGMALADIPAPLTTYEFHVIGNRVGDTLIAGLIYISQQGLNSGQGFINYIDYANGELRVGGIISNALSGTRVRINDPNPVGKGKYSKGLSPDIRFTCDPDNPTIRTETGWPMGLSVSAADDPLRPNKNRPKDAAGNPLSIFTFPDPATRKPTDPDPSLQLPFMIGDYITYAGTRVTDNTNAPTMGPWPTNWQTTTYISAHTIINNLGFFTAPGTVPAYVAVDVTILGTGGITVPGVAEATARTRFEGFCTDSSRVIDLFGIDLNCSTGAGTDRSWGSIDVDPGPPTGAVKGRWRFRPPSKVLALPPSGTFDPTTRNVRAVMRGAWLTGQTNLAANGVIYGQYQAPITGYLFPENITGSPIVPNNFDSAFHWLAQGGQTITDTNTGASIVVGQLVPWPGTPIPPGCGGAVAPTLPPIAFAGANQTVLSRATVTLNSVGSFDPQGLPLTGFAWTFVSGAPVVITSPGAAIATFTAPLVPFGSPPTNVVIQLIVTNSAGLASAPSTVTITVTAPATVSAPIANAGAPQTTVSADPLVILNGTASTDPNGLPLFFNWVQTPGNTPAVVLTGANTASPTFTAPTLTAGAPNVVLSFTLTVSNAFLASLPVTTTVTVKSTTATPPTAKVGPNQTVASDAAVTLNGSTSSDPQNTTLTFFWSQVGGPAAINFTTVPSSALATFTAPHVPAGSNSVVLSFQLIVTNALGQTSAPVTNTITVTAAPLLAPIVSAGTPQAGIPSGTAGVTLHGTVTDPNIPPRTPTIFWNQTTGPAVALTGATTLTPTFTAPTIAAGQPPAVLTFALTANNGLNVVATTTVSVDPIGINVVITAVEYRLRSRLTVNATASVIDPGLVLTLTEDGANPQPMQNLGGGLYQLVLVGVPQPNTVTVTAAGPGGGSATAPPPPFRIRN